MIIQMESIGRSTGGGSCAYLRAVITNAVAYETILVPTSLPNLLMTTPIGGRLRVNLMPKLIYWL